MLTLGIVQRHDPTQHRAPLDEPRGKAVAESLQADQRVGELPCKIVERSGRCPAESREVRQGIMGDVFALLSRDHDRDRPQQPVSTRQLAIDLIRRVLRV